MLERLQKIEDKYLELEHELEQPETISNIKRTLEITKEQASLREVYEAYQTYKKILNDILDAKEMVKDPELSEMAHEELNNLEANKTKLESEIEVMLLPKDPNDGKNVIVEIRGAAGGDEGNIFAGDLYRMYVKYAEKEGWKVEELESQEGSAGGYALISFMVKGENVYSKLKYESGAHRVQRVPETEAAGRVHTSTATVLVMPEAEDLDFELDMNEVRVDITRSSGCGGQGVNTTDSAVRLTHIPTGIVVACQTERSQFQNRDTAMKMLKSKLLTLKEQEQKETIDELKGVQMDIAWGSQIRSYIFCPYTLVKDHRTNYEVRKCSSCYGWGFRWIHE